MDAVFRQLTRGIRFDTQKFAPESTKMGLKVRRSDPATREPREPAAAETRSLSLDTGEIDAIMAQAEATATPGPSRANSDEEAEGQPAAGLRLLTHLPAEDGGQRGARVKKGAQLKGTAKRRALRVEQVNRFRNVHRIHVSGSDVPEPIDTWERLKANYGFPAELMASITEAYPRPTPIQMQVVPMMLENREVLACAPTGSGKTAAFLIPLLHLLRGPRPAGGFRAAIVAPTRELALQIHQEAVRLGSGLGLRVLVLDATNQTTKNFSADTAKRFDLLVSPPNRLVHLIQDEVLSLDQLEWLVVDESDKLFESGVQGFRDQLAVIYRACQGAQVRRAMFSATLAVDVEKWCQLNLDNVLTVTIGARNSATETVEQKLVYTGSEKGKLMAFRQLVHAGLKPPVLVFVQTKERAQELYEAIKGEHIHADVIHSDRSQLQRDQTVRHFRSGRVWVLICTELMGRGIDFKGVNLVVNYDFPPSTFSYIHRIGRTGRAGRAGQAVTFFTDQDKTLLRSIATIIKNAGGQVPDYMLTLKKASRQEKRQLAKKAVERDSIRRESNFERQQRAKKDEMIAGSKRRKRKAEGTDEVIDGDGPGEAKRREKLPPISKPARSEGPKKSAGLKKAGPKTTVGKHSKRRATKRAQAQKMGPSPGKKMDPSAVKKKGPSPRKKMTKKRKSSGPK